MDRAELRSWIDDALARHERDVTERGETPSVDISVGEILDATWGRLPLQVRRHTTRAQVQASLTMTALRRGVATAHGNPEAPRSKPAAAGNELDR